MKKKLTRKEKREAEKQINFFEEFLKIRKHFFCNFNQKLKSVNEVRHSSYITYEPDILLFTIIMKNISGIHSMNKMTKDFNNDTVINNFSKVLGYNDLEISRKFVVYASLASIIGSVIGILIGCNILPQIINTSYGSLYNLPSLTIYYYPSYVIQSILISILCTVGAALYVLRVELKSTPSNLMRAKAPKIGKKILLERITPLWKRLNFNQKVTFRNIFRYKQRMIMTVFGIAGCMAMLVTGYGLQDSNNGMLEKQFNKLWKYDAMVIFNDSSND